VLMGVGGAPEGVLTACAVKALGGGMQARLAPRDESDRAHLRTEGKDASTVLELEDLCAGENVFFAATGITDGELLEGVRFQGGTARTQSVVMRSWTGTIRYIDAVHNFPMLLRHAQRNGK
jgi:fructose-1,6-bisphosphatase II